MVEKAASASTQHLLSIGRGSLDKDSKQQTTSKDTKNEITNGGNQITILNYCVFPGNGPQVIRDAMARRSGK